MMKPIAALTFMLTFVCICVLSNLSAAENLHGNQVIKANFLKKLWGNPDLDVNKLKYTDSNRHDDVSEYIRSVLGPPKEICYSSLLAFRDANKYKKFVLSSIIEQMEGDKQFVISDRKSPF